MNIKLENSSLKSPVVELIERISGELVSNCYQCGNCTGGCPVAYAMDIAPTQMIRMLQLGRVSEVLEAESQWICVSCLQCYSRCPKGVSAASLFEAVRQINLRSGRNHAEISGLAASFLKDAPQQALVCGFRKLVG